MATAIPEITTATTITFAGSYFGRITSLGLSGMSRPSIEITHFGSTTTREFMPGDLYDDGQLTVTAHFDATKLPPIADAAESIAIVFPGGSPNTWTGTGFMIDASFEGPLEDVMVGTFVLKYDGQTQIAVTV